MLSSKKIKAWCIKMRKNVLVTGASRGIGRAIAERFAREGYNVYMTCKKHVDNLKLQAEEWSEKYGVMCIANQCDMADAIQVEELMEELPIMDVVVNNVGISYIGLLTDMSNEEWHEVINTNLNSIFYVCKHAVKGMIQRHCGKIINISSVWGNVGASMEVAYSTSKGGINAFTRALAKELAPSDIQVNAIACGVIDTEMNRCFDEDERKALCEEIPADRFGQAEEVAALVYDLAKGHNYLTGQVITLDGGWI